MRTLVLLAAIVLGVSSVFVYLSVRRATPSEADKTDFRTIDPEYLMPIGGEEVTLDQAQASVPFKIRMPTNMGAPVLIKVLLPPQTDTPQVFIIYAPAKLSSNASIPDVLDDNGIILFEAPNKVTLQEADINLKALIDSTGGQAISINGYFGYAGGNVQHCVSWATETTHYALSANIDYPLQQVVGIAQSIPVN